MKLCSDRMIFSFLIWVAKNTKQESTKQYVYYAISLFGIKLFGIDEDGVSTGQMENMPLIEQFTQA